MVLVPWALLDGVGVMTKDGAGDDDVDGEGEGEREDDAPAPLWFGCPGSR